MDISFSYPLYTVRRSCFAKHFSKTDSDSLENLLHKHSHKWRGNSSLRATVGKAPCGRSDQIVTGTPHGPHLLVARFRSFASPLVQIK
jgi:hypothetical protein